MPRLRSDDSCAAIVSTLGAGSSYRFDLTAGTHISLPGPAPLWATGIRRGPTTTRRALGLPLELRQLDASANLDLLQHLGQSGIARFGDLGPYDLLELRERLTGD